MVKIKYKSGKIREAASSLGFENFNLTERPLLQSKHREDSGLIKALTNEMSWTKTKRLDPETTQYISCYKRYKEGNPHIVLGKFTEDEYRNVASPYPTDQDATYWQQSQIIQEARAGNYNQWKKNHGLSDSTREERVVNAIMGWICGTAVAAPMAMTATTCFLLPKIANYMGLPIEANGRVEQELINNFLPLSGFLGATFGRYFFPSRCERESIGKIKKDILKFEKTLHDRDATFYLQTQLNQK